MTQREAIRGALCDAMRDDERVILIGEDIGIYGGAFGVSRGMLEEFGSQRVIQTPISENGFVGAAVGAAVGGLRPVVEIMFADFVTCCMDALVNHAAKFRYMYDGQVTVPMVLRTPMGRRMGYGATHSQSPEAFFLHVPGLKVVAPATPADALELLRASIDDPDPVLFFEHKLLYDAEGPSSNDVPRRLGEARVVREGRSVTLISYSRGTSLCLDAANELASAGIAAEVIDLGTLSPLDLSTCLESVRKTGRAVVVSEDPLTGGVASRVAVDIMEHAFEFLMAPVMRVSAADVPVPASRDMEEIVHVSVAQIVERARQLAVDY
jgi:pyruvate/2-oxoglutarate/acetoin dehydrogenase E1 component